MKPKVARKTSFRVVGLAESFTPSTNDGIPALWARFALRMDSVPNRIGLHSFGVCVPADTVKQVWGVWLPASGHRRHPSPDFEYYDARFDAATGNGEVDVEIPIADEVEG